MEDKVTTLSEQDKMQLDLIKASKRVALAEAKEHVVKSEKAELEYKNFVLQIFIKYKLTEFDSIDESGNISYGSVKKE